MHVLGDKVVNPNRLLLSKAVLQALRSNKRFPKPLNVCFTQHRTFPPWGRRRRVSFIVPVSSSKRKCPCRFGLDTVEDLALLSLSWLQSKDRLLDTQGKRKKTDYVVRIVCSLKPASPRMHCTGFRISLVRVVIADCWEQGQWSGHSLLLRLSDSQWQHPVNTALLSSDAIGDAAFFCCEDFAMYNEPVKKFLSILRKMNFPDKSSLHSHTFLGFQLHSVIEDVKRTF